MISTGKFAGRSAYRGYNIYVYNMGDLSRFFPGLKQQEVQHQPRPGGMPRNPPMMTPPGVIMHPRPMPGHRGPMFYGAPRGIPGRPMPVHMPVHMPAPVMQRPQPAGGDLSSLFPGLARPPIQSSVPRRSMNTGAAQPGPASAPSSASGHVNMNQTNMSQTGDASMGPSAADDCPGIRIPANEFSFSIDKPKRGDTT